ncbi:hypothetical protein AB0D10_32870 [Kitasatospora sp. NPDC048545]|uniref:hypothetical protein n=1 Tax=Kitasatospora sp. NPDC048545 TaxID=3157208 RepID=UPI0033D4129C
MPARIPGRRRAGLAGFAGLVLTVGLALTGCDPSAAGPAAPATPAVAPAATTPPDSPATRSQPPTPKAPQPKVTTAKPPTDPEPAPTAPAAAGGAGCDIRSNAGNCYEAGQFCRNGDLGKSTHDASGRAITCRMVSGKPHWQA